MINPYLNHIKNRQKEQAATHHSSSTPTHHNMYNKQTNLSNKINSYNIPPSFFSNHKNILKITTLVCSKVLGITSVNIQNSHFGRLQKGRVI